MIRTNRRVNVWRPAQLVSGISAIDDLEPLYPDVRAWLKLASALVVTREGSETTADGELRISRAIRQGDVVGIVDSDRKYRIEGVDELLAPSGRVDGYRAFLVRDASLE